MSPTLYATVNPKNMMKGTKQLVKIWGEASSQRYPSPLAKTKGARPKREEGPVFLPRENTAFRMLNRMLHSTQESPYLTELFRESTSQVNRMISLFTG